MALPAEELRYTFADYLSWDEDDHVELIDGKRFPMEMPFTIHQRIRGDLGVQLCNYLRDTPCEIFIGPLPVRLFEKETDSPSNVSTVLIPDIWMVCDPGKLDDYGCKGAPDLIIEILSPSSRRHDRIVKLDLYQKAGVREYWVVNPEDRTVQVMLLKDSYLLPVEDYGREDMAKVNVLEDCAIDLSKVFLE